MISALRRVALLTCPEKNHLVHQLIEATSTHPLRVFVCLCLKISSWDKEAISHQLRWDLDTIKFYIHQVLFQANEVGVSLFQVALVI